MKKNLLTLAAALLVATSAWAQTSFTLDGLKYQETGVGTGQVRITGYTIEPKGVLDIPETVSPSTGEKYTVTQIADEVFSECTDLTEVILPAQINEVGDHAFHYCQKITSITCYNKTPPAMGESAFANTDESTPVYVPHNAMSSYKNDSYWSQFTNIRFISFYSDNLHYKVLSTFPNQVEIIGYTTMPAGVLEIPELVIHKGKDYAVLNIAEEVFAECSGLTELIFPTSLKLIGAHAFHYCQNLMSITCYRTTPPAVGESAFAAADESIPVYVPAASLAAYKTAEVWKEFTNLQAIVVNEFTAGNLRYEVTDKTAETVTVTGYVNTPEGALEIPSTVEHKGTTYSVISIGKEAFYDCTGLTSLTLPASLTSIETYALYNCSGLTKMTVFATTPPTVEGGAFYNISKETPVYVPAESLEDYKASVWKGFTNLQAISGAAIDTPSMPESISIQGGMLHNPQQLHLTLYDMQGRQVYSGTDATVSQPAGVYVVRCAGASGKVLF